MKSPTPFADKALSQRGFTLIEILVVVSMMVIIMSFGIFFDMDKFRQNSFQADRDILISALQHARSQAISNICYGDTSICQEDGKPHGVYIESHQFTIFQGTDFANRNIVYDAILETEYDIAYSGLTEVVFDQLTGDVVSGAGSITMTDPLNSRSSVISINSEGQIIWTN